MVSNRQQAEDIAQTAFLKAYQALANGTLVHAETMSSWLYRIASNCAIDALRRRRLLNWLPLSLFADDSGFGPDMSHDPHSASPQHLPYAELAVAMLPRFTNARFEQQIADREIIDAVLQRMSVKNVQCLLLYQVGGLSCNEIAEYLHISPPAVKMTLMRARRQFINLYKLEAGDKTETGISTQSATSSRT